MNKVRELQSFFYGQNFADGIRVTIGVLLPALLFSYMGQLLTGITVSLGAVGASLADSPGPVVHKRNGMLVAILLCTVVAMVTGFAQRHVVTMGLEIGVFCFLFSMLLVYGMRASLIGLGALLVMILSMHRPLTNVQVFQYAGLVLTGGVWYLLLSLLSHQMMPYRPAQQALGESVREVAKYLRIKASFYRSPTDMEPEYRRLVAQQVLVSEKQVAAREVLFKSRQMVQESTDTGRTLVMIFVDLVDLYEQITSIHYDYASINEKFAGTGVLRDISEIIERLADELDRIGLALQANYQPGTPLNVLPQLESLKQKIEAIDVQEPTAHTLVLKKILVNIRGIVQRLTDIRSYFNTEAAQEAYQNRELQFSLFVTRQNFSPRLLWSNMGLSSSVFRFSLRMALVAVVAFALTRLFPYGEHSYWVLLTVVFILKPAFSLTKQRNVQRIIGTVLGGAIGLLILYLFKNETIQFVFMVLFMTGFYTVQRMNYVLSVTLMTPFMLILFSFLGGGGLAIVEERLVDTVAGCAIAFAATYLILPNWESKQVGTFLQNALKANLNYLQVLAGLLAGNAVSNVQYKLARKEVNVKSADLSAAFQRMAAEPKSKQLHSREIYQLVVLNHVLSSYIATVISGKINAQPCLYPEAIQKNVRRSLHLLTEAIRHLDPAFQLHEAAHSSGEPSADPPATLSADDRLLAEQLEFIRKVAADIHKYTSAMAEPGEGKE
ncbi:FUSC family membrane protein [Rufibacter quisquiliarum]|uniref:Putative membrane protein (TIGR01666 family) n=1 Tax=Rufibacter quisquiliarum TaxID=1549639 RepID=A0A839GPC4_9BACT|nr:FUSC family membrane protein [Rufibacter quisquiliarum]MBA9076298.1 putative membrane protein (TIGR01666 family) [Rufibacter quisquiliarum]